MNLVEQDLLTLTCLAPEFTPVSCYSIFSFMCIFCRSLFVLLYFFFWPLCCLFFCDLRILITPLVSSNSSLVLFESIYGKEREKSIVDCFFINSLDFKKEIIPAWYKWNVSRLNTFSTSCYYRDEKVVILEML